MAATVLAAARRRAGLGCVCATPAQCREAAIESVVPPVPCVSPLQRPPRHPWLWLWWFGASQAGGLLAGWFWSWPWGLALLMGGQALLFWATLWPRSRVLSPVLTRLPATRRAVWLTIDDGPSADTGALLDLLDRHGAHACFFLVAERAQARPRDVAEILRRGHEIGNHSYSHPEKWFWALPPAAMHAQIRRAQSVLAGLTGAPPRWFRAVVGMANPFVAGALRPLGLTRVAWSARGFDAREADPERVVARVRRGLAPGAIVLLHEGAPHGRSVDIVSAVLAALQADGYRCLTPDQLAAGEAESPPREAAVAAVQR